MLKINPHQETHAIAIIPRPLYGSAVPAGFPSPADDHIQNPLDLNEYIIKHPASTFFVRVSGDSMKDAGISPGDILAVDRSLNPSHGKIVIAILDGELTVKKLQTLGGVKLKAENPRYQDIIISSESDLQIWGVVTHAIKSF